MDRLACVDLPFFPLQLLLRRHPEWRKHPVVVVDSDKPQGIIRYVNERARSFRILPGMRYAAGLSLTGDLRAAVMPRADIDRTTAAIGRRLRRFTPHVEPATEEPGVFWLDASGLERLHDSVADWAGLVSAELKRCKLHPVVAVGFSRFGTYAVAKAARGTVIFEDRGQEKNAARRVPLDRLSLEPKSRDALHKLGITTVGNFIELPPDGIHRRFGPEVHRLHRLATGELQLPIQPEEPRPPVMERACLDDPETSVPRLMVVIEKLMQPLIAGLVDRGEALAAVRVGFCFEKIGDHIECVRPATPTLDVAQMLELIRLRLQAVRKLPDGVVEVVLVAEGHAATRQQLQLFSEQPRSDLAAANRSLARVRAEFGDDTVVRARLREGHLPEGSYTWEALDKLAAASPRNVGSGCLVRRIQTRPIPLPSRPRQEPDGWMLRGLKQGPVVRVFGPYIVAGGWWNRPVHREYHFAETQKGEMLWVFYDRNRRRWYAHGRVE